MEEDAWGLLLAGRWTTTMVSGAGKGAGCCCMSAGRGGGIGMGGESVWGWLVLVTAQGRKMESVEWYREGLVAKEGRPVWWTWCLR